MELREPVVIVFKGEIQVAKTTSVRVPKYSTGADQFVVVLRFL